MTVKAYQDVTKWSLRALREACHDLLRGRGVHAGV